MAGLLLWVIVGGTDTLRGCAFQIVQALCDVIEILPDPGVAAVRVEGRDDVVDCETLDIEGRRLRAWQAKTRQGSDTWGAADLATVLAAWGRTDDADQVEFTFVTDGRLGPTGQQLDQLVQAIRQNPDLDLRVEAAALGRGGSGISLPPVEVLQRVRILSDRGTSDHLLVVLERSIQRLIERRRKVTTANAENAASRLFRLFFIRGGNVDLTRRVIHRAEILAVLGIDEVEVRGGVVWSQEVAAAYRKAVTAAARHSQFLPLDVVSIAAMPAVLRLMDRSERDPGTGPRPLDEVLTEPVAVIAGATGQGKTTSLRYLAGKAAAQGMIAVTVPAAGHVAGALDRRIRNAIESALDQQLTAGALQMVLASPDLLLLIDGASEAKEESRTALRADLQLLAAQRPVRVVATGRDLPRVVAVVDVAGTPAAYRLTSLDAESRRQIASGIAEVQPGVVEEIEHRLSDAVDNPMLFVMALSVSGNGVPDSRAAVYEQFICGLAARTGVGDVDDALAAFGAAWTQMIASSQRAADRYTWRSMLRSAVDTMRASRSMDVPAIDAAHALDIAQAMGLLVQLDADGGLTAVHDSFADFLVGRALARGHAALPAHLSGEYDEAILFLADLGGLDPSTTYQLAKENPLLACRASQLPTMAGQADPAEVGRLVTALAGDCTLPLLGPSRGVRILHHAALTGLTLADDGIHALVDKTTFDELITHRPAIMVDPGTGSLALAVQLWATAVTRAQQPTVRVVQPAPPLDCATAMDLLRQYVQAVQAELLRMVNTTLPRPLRSRVLSALGPRGVAAVVDEPAPGLFGNLEMGMRYRLDEDVLVVPAGDPRVDASQLPGETTVERFMVRHPINHAAHEIRQGPGHAQPAHVARAMSARVWQAAKALADLWKTSELVQRYASAALGYGSDHMYPSAGHIDAQPFYVAYYIHTRVAFDGQSPQPQPPAWTDDGLALAAVYTTLIEFLRSRLAGYPFPNVPHLSEVSPWTSANVSMTVPWLADLREDQMHTHPTPPVFPSLGIETAVELPAMIELMHAVQTSPPADAIARAWHALSESDRSQLANARDALDRASYPERAGQTLGDEDFRHLHWVTVQLDTVTQRLNGRARTFADVLNAADAFLQQVAALFSHIVFYPRIRTLQAIDLVEQLDGCHGWHTVRSRNYIWSPIRQGEIVAFDHPYPAGLMVVEGTSERLPIGYGIASTTFHGQIIPDSHGLFRDLTTAAD